MALLDLMEIIRPLHFTSLRELALLAGSPRTVK